MEINDVLQWASLLLAYFTGNLSLSYYWVRYSRAQDLRDLGSGSLGARNASRLLGRRGFLLIALFDISKGALAVMLTHWLTGDDRLTALAMVAVVAGHIWPVLLGFKGGKGVATSVGALFILSPGLGLVFALSFLLLYLLLRHTLAAALLAYLFLPLLVLLPDMDQQLLLPVGLCAVSVLWAHRKNIKQLCYSRRDSV